MELETIQNDVNDQTSKDETSHVNKIDELKLAHTMDQARFQTSAYQMSSSHSDVNRMAIGWQSDGHSDALSECKFENS